MLKRILNRPWAGTFVIGLLIRTLWIQFVQPKPISDFFVYQLMAQRLAVDSFAHPGATFSLGYPVLLSLLYRLGFSDFGVLLLQSIFGAGTVALVALILDRTASTRAAWFGGLLLAVSPGHIFFTSVLGTETLYGFLITLAIFLLSQVYIQAGTLEGGQKKVFQAATWVGVVVGISVSVRSLGLFLSIPILAGFLFSFGAGRGIDACGKFLLGLIPTLLLLGSYEFRTRGVFRFSADHGSYLVWQGTLPETQGGYIMDLSLPEAERAGSAKDRIYLSTAFRNIQERPLAFAKLVMQKLRNTYQAPGFALHWNFISETGVTIDSVTYRFLELWLKVFQRVIWILIALGLMAGGVLAYKRHLGDFNLSWKISLSFLAYFSAVFIATIGNNRFQVPLIPLFCAFIAASPYKGAWNLLRRVSK